jgi:hypothetical protein
MASIMSDEIFSSFRECLIQPRRKNGMKIAKCVFLVIVFMLCCVDPGFTLIQEKRNTPTPETRPESSESTAEEQLDVNTASMQELLLIPGLGKGGSK